MRRWFYLVIGLQLLFLLGEAASVQVGLSRGRVVTLKVLPVDPRSLFMGNYMALAYDISAIDLSSIQCDAPLDHFRPGDTIYVGLIARKPWALASAVTKAPPTPDETMPYLRGRITDKYGSTIRIAYGLERYFIPEDKQADVARLQQALRESSNPPISVEISVQEDGQGLIRRVLLRGRPLGF